MSDVLRWAYYLCTHQQQSVEIARKVRNTDIDWALGAVFYELVKSRPSSGLPWPSWWYHVSYAF